LQDASEALATAFLAAQHQFDQINFTRHGFDHAGPAKLGSGLGQSASLTKLNSWKFTCEARPLVVGFGECTHWRVVVVVVVVVVIPSFSMPLRRHIERRKSSVMLERRAGACWLSTNPLLYNKLAHGSR
jgi:hypothetical protein